MNTLLVCGLARCGTSLTMQMLDAGGYPCVGEYPSYETRESSAFELTNDYVKKASGAALKVIDPQMATARGVDLSQCRIIFLTRDPIEQAKSQIKMANMIFKAAEPTRENIRAMSAGIKRDLQLCRKIFKGQEVLYISFENLITKPENTVSKLSDFVGGIDEGKALSQLRLRKPENYTGFLEMELIENA